MALYRLHKKIWDKGYVAPLHKIKKKKSKAEITATTTSDETQPGKRKRGEEEGEEELPTKTKTTKVEKKSNKKQAISSGLSVVMKSRKGGVETKQVVSGTRSQGKATGGEGGKDTKWWATLGK